VFDLSQFPGTEQADRVGIAGPTVERTLAAIDTLTTQAVMQASAVEVQCHAPTVNIDFCTQAA